MMAKDKVRPNSRAGLIVKTMLDRCEVPRLPSLFSDARGFAVPEPIARSERLDLTRYIRRGMGVVEPTWLIYTASNCWKMDARDHDAHEVRQYIDILGQGEGWLCHTIYAGDAVVLFSPWEARGRWMLATEGEHDFPAECPLSWRLPDGTSAGEPPPGKPL